VSMSNTFGTLLARKKVKIEDMKPGSIVEVSNRAEPGLAPMTATILQVMREYGPVGIPALLVKPHPQPGVEMEPSMLIFADGKWIVDVVQDSSGFGQEDPDDVLEVTPVLQTKHALRFEGGIESAEKVIRWAAGKSVITYHSGDANSNEHLTVHSIEGELRAEIGDYIVRDQHGEHRPERPEVLHEQYDWAGKDE
jgi:hypothetical protein